MSPKNVGIAEDSTKILFVGRLVPEKGIFVLLNAFSMLLKKVQKVELIIVGSGSINNQNRIKQITANLKIERKVRFLGSIAYPFMAQIHNQADIFCLPIFQLKIGLSNLAIQWSKLWPAESQSFQLQPVVYLKLSRIALPEFVVKPNNPTGLETAIEELVLNEHEREMFGNNGRKWVLQSFEANMIAEKLAQTYEKYL